MFLSPSDNPEPDLGQAGQGHGSALQGPDSSPNYHTFIKLVLETLILLCVPHRARQDGRLNQAAKC